MSNLSLVTDKMLPVSNETFIDNLSAGISAGAAIVTINSLAEYSDGDTVVLTVDPGTALQATFIGEKQGNTVINCKWTEGNVGASHASGATVIDYDSSTHYNVVTKLLRIFANQNGTLKPGAISSALGVTDSAGIVNPVGSVVEFAGVTAPTGWFMCDGAAISRASYPNLFNIISPLLGNITVTIAANATATLINHGLITGNPIHLTTTGNLPTGLTTGSQFFAIKIDNNTFRFATSRANALAGTAITTSGTQSGVHSVRLNPYGVGDGSTTFNVPDIRKRVPVGLDPTDSNFTSLGDTGGAKTHALTVNEIPNHAHRLNTINGSYGAQAGGSGYAGSLAITWGGGEDDAVTGPSYDGLNGAAHNNLQPYITLNYIIKW